MCKLVDLDVNDRKIKVADIKKKYVENLIESIKLCDAIDKVVLFGSSLDENCKEISDVDVAIFGRYPKSRMFRLRSYHNFINAVTSYGELQDYDLLYFESGKIYDDFIFEDIKKGEILYERV